MIPFVMRFLVPTRPLPSARLPRLTGAHPADASAVTPAAAPGIANLNFIALRRDQVHVPTDIDRAQTLYCVAGALWITQSNDPHDTVLQPGQSLLTTPGQKTVVQALVPSILIVR